MGKIYKVEWKCDKPSCNATEVDNNGGMPSNWSEVTFEINADVDDCDCDCHAYDIEDDERTADHDEDDCGCPDEDNMRRSYFCSTCTMILKSQYFDKARS